MNFVNLTLVVGFVFLNPQLLARSLFLNGEDVSGARNQVLEKVDVSIDEYGDIFIVAPQYKAERKSRGQAKTPSVALPQAPIPEGGQQKQVDRRRPVDESVVDKAEKNNSPQNPYVTGNTAVPAFVDTPKEPASVENK